MKRLFILLSAFVLSACGDDDGVSDASVDTTSDVSPDVPEGPACTPSGLFCEAGEICDRGGRCEEGPGTCIDQPTACPEPGGEEEVCGCDQRRYASRCIAHSMGVDVMFEASCPE